MSARRTSLRADRGAEAVELALVAPVALLALLAALYGLLAVAAQVSLAHAASAAAREAVVPADDGTFSVYPGAAELNEIAAGATAFFAAEDCTTQVTGGPGPNAVVFVDLACSFPNPFGRVLGLGTDATLTMTARASGRRE